MLAFYSFTFSLLCGLSDLCAKDHLHAETGEFYAEPAESFEYQL